MVVFPNKNEYLITYCLELAPHGGNKNHNHFDQFYSLFLNTVTANHNTPLMTSSGYKPTGQWPWAKC